MSTESRLLAAVGTRVALRPLVADDSDFAYQLFVDPEVGGRLGRWSGGVPSREQVLADLWTQVLAHYVVVGRDTSRRIGIVTISTADFRNGYCYMAVLADRSARGRGLALEGVALAIRQVFWRWPFRKIYFEAVERNVEQFRRISRYMKLEARYVDHVYDSGRYRDVVVYSLHRDSWEQRIAPSLLRLLR